MNGIVKKDVSILCICFAIGIYSIYGLGYGWAGEKKGKKADSRSDPVIDGAEFNSITCYQSPHYLVVAKEVKGRTGTDFLIKTKSNPEEKVPCQYSIGNSDFELKNEWAEYFAGLKGDLLILDSTTGPGPSGLTIWDLKKRRKVYEGSWSDPEESTNDSLVYWMETGEANDTNCPGLKHWKANGLGAAIETKVILSLTNFKISKTQERRCSPRQ